MDTKPELKASVIITDIPSYITECEKFESKNKVVQKHVSSQIIQMPNPAAAGGIKMPGQPETITTAMISVLYVHEVVKN